MRNHNPFRYFKTSPEVIRLAVMMYVRFPLSLRNVEDLLHERGIDICHETVRYWWNRFGPMFAREIRKKRHHPTPNYSNWRWHLDEVFVKINGDTHYLWRAVDHEGEVLEVFATKRRDREAALERFKTTTVILDCFDISKSRVETVDEMEARLKSALMHIDRERLIAAPDCGLGLLPRRIAMAKMTNLCVAAARICTAAPSPTSTKGA